MSSNSKSSNLLFSYFSFLQNLLLLVLEICPPFLRTVIFKLTMKEFGKNVLVDYKCYFRYPSKIKIGNNVSINRGCEFYPSRQFKDAFIVLEDDTVLGPNITFSVLAKIPEPTNYLILRRQFASAVAHTLVVIQQFVMA